MSGSLRNLLTVLWALWHYQSAAPQSRTVARFFVTPFDTGLTTLKSDKYLQLAESAQIDYLIKTGLIREMLAKGYSFVNASQLVRFVKPVRFFSRVTVDSQLVYADDKCAYFCHTFLVKQIKHAKVFVKMKFKKGPVTIAPAELLGAFSGAKPLFVQRWDAALVAASTEADDKC